MKWLIMYMLYAVPGVSNTKILIPPRKYPQTNAHSVGILL